ncbi:hypothetical protein QQ054_36215 [Oscillatoria amoena NRMC-F 0135]|nr:hypothetical protein [Oscillatoria amoena NRMC-F 0135]
MQAEDRIIFLEKRAKKFLRQTPSVWDSIDIGRIPDNGGVILITLLGERKEIPIHINYCKSLKKGNRFTKSNTGIVFAKRKRSLA